MAEDTTKEKKKEECPVCGDEFFNLGAHMKAHEGDESEKDEKTESDTPEQKVSGESSPKKKSDVMSQLMDTIENINQNVNDLSKRVNKIETGGKYEFKEDAKEEDIKKAKEMRETSGVDDPRVTQVVDELLGEDFGVRIEKNEDKPGFMFRIVVPSRLSPRDKAERPVRKKDPSHPRDYKTDQHGDTVMEEYYPEDVRSRAISSKDSYDAIRDHCQKIQGNIIAWHQKLNKPMPEFKVKDNQHA